MKRLTRYLLLIFILSISVSLKIVTATEQNSIISLLTTDQDIYTIDKSYTYSYELWEGNVDPNNDELKVTLDISAMTSTHAVLLHIRFWERLSEDYWGNYGEINWTIENEGSTSIETNWYSHIPESVVGIKQKMDFLASTEDRSEWEADIKVEISIEATFIASGWVTDPKPSTDVATITPGFDIWPLLSSLTLIICYYRKREQKKKEKI